VIELNISEEIRKRPLFFDGGFGTQLIERGLKPSENSAEWNVSRLDVITAIHIAYIEAGADIITTNTFSASPNRSPDYAEYIRCGVDAARRAADGCKDRKVFVALDIGPSGIMLKPYGSLDFEDAVSLYADIIKAADHDKIDLILLETFGECLDTKAAVLAAKENSSLPVFVSNTYDKDGRMLTGTTPEAMAVMLEGLRVDAVGCNCSCGPDLMLDTAKRLMSACSLPVFANPNAGLPTEVCGKYVYDMNADKFAGHMLEFAKCGISAMGGCCGTTPEFISKMAAVPGSAFVCSRRRVGTFVSSGITALEIGKTPLIVGERINPTGKPKLKEALRAGNIDYLVDEAMSQDSAGAHILDVNVGLPEISESEMLPEAIMQIQTVTGLPLQIDSVDPTALEKALRVYAGKPIINSVNGKEKSMREILPLAAKYGGVVIALTLDEHGIPDSAEKRASIAAKIVKEAEKYGINRKDMIVDPLTLAISSDPESAKTTLKAIDIIKNELGLAVSLGVSNISFGLPGREMVNSSFYAEALAHGLDLAIINPLSFDMMRTYRAHQVLAGNDEACRNYIDFASSVTVEKITVADKASATASNQHIAGSLEDAIIGGMKDQAQTIAGGLLASESPVYIIEKRIVPALDAVGKKFENKTLFLPQLLMSAEAASAAFGAVRQVLPKEGAEKGSVILATVRGDLHDIGKNIVKTMLGSYGFNVIDLGKDVPPEKVLSAVVESGVRLVGLSALMTTTIPSMKETIELLKRELPDVFVVVGGAVLTREYAETIGADAYAEDAMETVRIADEYYSSKQ